MRFSTKSLQFLIISFYVIIISCGSKPIYHDIKADIEASGSFPVAVATYDQRKLILSGELDPSFVGTLRGGFGNPFRNDCQV